MNNIKGVAYFSLIASLLIGAAQAGGPVKHYLQSLTYGGSGTPQGSVGSSFSNDRLSYTLIFDSFVASQGPDVPVTEGIKSSQINLNLAGNNGLAVISQDLRGYVQLPAGATATVTITEAQSSDDKGKQVEFTETFTGPMSKDYLFHSEFKVKGAQGNLFIQISFDGPANSMAQVTVDSLDGKITK